MLKVKPPYSKDGKLQLCSRCNRYCGRTKNICPTCDKRDSEWNAAVAKTGLDLSKMKAEVLWALNCRRHFIGSFDGKIGYFLVWNPGQILDRAAYREIAAEAKAVGLQSPYMIWGRIATYMGPGINFMQIGVN